jgi:hypothetical protein
MYGTIKCDYNKYLPIIFFGSGLSLDRVKDFWRLHKWKNLDIGF